MSDTPRTDDAAISMTDGLRRRDKYGAYVDSAFARLLERAFNTACAFIDCHAADPDITAEMCRAYAIFCERRKDLDTSLNDKALT